MKKNMINGLEAGKNFTFNKKTSRWRQIVSIAIVVMFIACSIGIANTIMIKDDDGDGVLEISGGISYDSIDADIVVYVADDGEYVAVNRSGTILKDENFVDVLHAGFSSLTISSAISNMGRNRIIRVIGDISFNKSIYIGHPYFNENRVNIVLDLYGANLSLDSTATDNIPAWGGVIYINTSYITILGGVINGNDVGTGYDGIRIVNCLSDGKLQNSIVDTLIYQFSYTGIKGTTSNVRRWYFENVQVKYCGGDGFSIPGTDNTYVRCIAYHNGDKGFNNIGSWNQLISCVADGNDAHGILFYENSYGQIVSGGYSEYNGKNGIGIYENQHNIKIDGMHILENGKESTGNDCYGIYVNGSSNNITICNIYAVDDGVINQSYAVGLGNLSFDCVVYDIDGSENDNKGVEDKGVRNIFNGVSYNDGTPGSAGNWVSFTKEGVFVWDDSNSKFYVYCSSSWNEITLT